MGVPVYGTYVSEDKNFSIQITSADPGNGTIAAIYKSAYSPEGALSTEGKIGQYRWVFSKSQNKDGVAPFSISFSASFRPDKRPYSITDSWTGAYLANNTLLMEGARSYVNSDGVISVGSLGTLKFTIAAK